MITGKSLHFLNSGYSNQERHRRRAGELLVEIHPDDAAPLGLKEGDLARIATPHGTATLETMVTDAVRPGNLFAAFHWSAATASDARVGALVRGVPDPVSGQPVIVTL